MASVTTSLALGAKQAVRGAKLAGKRTAAPKAVNVTAKAQISKGTRPPSFARRFDAAKTSISILPALPACSSFRPSRTRDDADPDPHPSRVAVDKAAAVAAASTLAVTPAARASELGEVRSFFHHGNRQPLAETDPPRSRGAGFTKRRRRRFFHVPDDVSRSRPPSIQTCAPADQSTPDTPTHTPTHRHTQELFSIFDSIDKAADKVENAINVAADAAGKAAEVAGKAAEVAAPVVSRAAEAARPVADAGFKYVERTAGPIANDLAGKAAQTASGAAATASDSIKARGIDLDPAAGAAKTAAGYAADKAADLAPSVASFGDFLQTATPVELVQTAGAAGALYLLAPAALGAVASAARGYAGSIRPVEAYDEALSGGNVVVVDVRSEADASRGALEFPRRAAGRVVSVPREKLSGNFKNMGDVEATLTATKIASLKGVKRSTKVFVLDANGRGDGPKVAKALGAQGFGRVFVVEGGFNGWANSGLGISA